MSRTSFTHWIHERAGKVLDEAPFANFVDIAAASSRLKGAAYFILRSEVVAKILAYVGRSVVRCLVVLFGGRGRCMCPT